MTDERVSRRRFLGRGCRRAAGLGLLPLVGCAAGETGGGRLAAGAGSPFPRAGYPLLEVGGGHREIGLQIARAMGHEIGPFLDRSALFRGCLAFLRRNEGRRRVQEFAAAARARFPRFVAEVEGMAAGLGLPFLDLFAYQCKNEIRELGREAGCSTLVTWRPVRLGILGHNEDGSVDNAPAMFLLRVSPPSGVEFLTLAYPGLLPGNGPGFNSRGIVQTTNYIRPRRVARGIPRYLISRAVMEARSLEEAVALATTSPRAFPFHHNLCDLGPRGRCLSLETHPARWDMLEIAGKYLHTNHFLHPAMLGPGGKPVLDRPYQSSLTRYAVLRPRFGPEFEVTGRGSLLSLLSLHEGRPYSPCRHPRGKVRGITLGTAFFVRGERRMVLYEGNPCRGRRREVSL